MEEPDEPKRKGLGTEVAKAAELVNYQDGSIVSREMVKKPTGTVTVFAFDEGQGLSEHTAPFDALVHALEGEADPGYKGTGRHVFFETLCASNAPTKARVAPTRACAPQWAHAMRRIRRKGTLFRISPFSQ